MAAIDTARLDQAFEYAQRSSQHGGLLVVRHGWLVYEKYYGKGSRQANPTMASVGKAYTQHRTRNHAQREARPESPKGLIRKCSLKSIFLTRFRSTIRRRPKSDWVSF